MLQASQSFLVNKDAARDNGEFESSGLGMTNPGSLAGTGGDYTGAARSASRSRNHSRSSARTHDDMHGSQERVHDDDSGHHRKSKRSKGHHHHKHKKDKERGRSRERPRDDRDRHRHSDGDGGGGGGSGGVGDSSSHHSNTNASSSAYVASSRRNGRTSRGSDHGTGDGRELAMDAYGGRSRTSSAGGGGGANAGASDGHRSPRRRVGGTSRRVVPAEKLGRGSNYVVPVTSDETADMLPITEERPRSKHLTHGASSGGAAGSNLWGSAGSLAETRGGPLAMCGCTTRAGQVVCVLAALVVILFVFVAILLVVIITSDGTTTATAASACTTTAAVPVGGKVALGEACRVTTQCPSGAACIKAKCAVVDCVTAADCSGACQRCSAHVCRNCGNDELGVCRCS